MAVSPGLLKVWMHVIGARMSLPALLMVTAAAAWAASTSDSASAAGPAPQNQQPVELALHNSAIIDNGVDGNGDGDTADAEDLPATVQMGINDQGHLNVAGGTPSFQSNISVVGLRYVPTNGESTAPGCLCEGWGVADASTGTTGYANIAVDGVFNLELESFTASGTGTSAVGPGAPAGSPFREATSVVVVRSVTVDVCAIVAVGGEGEAAPEGSICNEDESINAGSLLEFLCFQFGLCGPGDPADVCADLGLCDSEGNVDLQKVVDDLCFQRDTCAAYDEGGNTPFGTDPEGLDDLCAATLLCEPSDPAALADYYCLYLGVCAPFDAAEYLCGLGLCNGEGGLEPALVKELVCGPASGFSCAGASILGDPVMRVTHHYAPSVATRNLYEVTVTMENLDDQPIGDLRYRRVMDWDIPPTTFSELSTIQGCCGNANGNPDDDPALAADNLIRTDTNGFDTPNPLRTRGSFQSGNVVDAGPADHGALFDFAFGVLGVGESKTFKTYYGAAGNEADSLAALAAVGAEAYSFGQPDGAGETGAPNTFTLAFSGIGGEPQVLPTEARIIDDDIEMVKMRSSYRRAADAAHPDLSPGGVLTVTATWQNNSANSFFDVFFDVAELEGAACPCVLLDADGGPGGVGAHQSVPNEDLAGGNELWDQGELLEKRVFRIGLATRAPLSFFVSVWGAEADAGP